MDPVHAAPPPRLELHALPDELIAHVLARVPSIRDLGRAHCVCHAWHKDDSPVELALRLRIAARGGAVPAAPESAGSMAQWLCWLELLRDGRASSGLVVAGTRTSAAVDAQGQLRVCGEIRDALENMDRSDWDVFLTREEKTVVKRMRWRKKLVFV